MSTEALERLWAASSPHELMDAADDALGKIWAMLLYRHEREGLLLECYMLASTRRLRWAEIWALNDDLRGLRAARFQRVMAEIDQVLTDAGMPPSPPMS